MSLFILFSLTLRLIATVLAVHVSIRQRDRRILLLAAVVFLTTVRLSSQLLHPGEPMWPPSWRFPASELPGLGVSLLAIPAVFYLGQLIEENRRSLRQLQRQDERIASAESMASVLTGLATREGRWIKPPKRLSSLFDTSALEIAQSDVASLFLAADRPALETKWAAVATGVLKSFDLELRAGTNAENPRWIQISAALSFDETKRPDCILVHLRDVTDRKQAEHEIRRNNDHMLTVLNASPLAFVSVDEHSQVQIWNQSAERVFGWKAEEVIGRPLPVIPEARQSDHDAIIGRSWKGECVAGIETQNRRRDGSLFDIRLWTAPHRDSTGRTIGVFMVIDDLTDEKKIEHALVESERRLRLLVENLNVVAWEADPKTWQFTFVTGDPVRFSGFTAEEWCQPNFWAEHIHPDDRAAAIEYCSTQSSGGLAHDFEYRLIKKDGSVIWVHDYVSVEVESGAPVLLRGLMLDVTAAKHTQDLLLASEENFRTTVEATQVGIWELDVESGRMEVSPEWTQQLGYEVEDIADPAAAWNEWVHPEEGQVIRNAFSEFLAGDDSRFEVEMRLRHLDGDYRWILSRGTKLRSSRTGKRVVRGVHIDITPQKKIQLALKDSEQRFRGIADYGSVGIWEITLDGRTVFASKVMARMLDVARPEELIGLSADEFLTPESRASVRRHLERRGHGEATNYEAELISRKGHLVHVIICGVPLYGPDGKVCASIGILTDITQRRRAERQLAESREQFVGIVNSAMDAIITIDEEQRIVLFNAAAEAMFMYRASEVIGESVEIVIPERYRSEHSKHVRSFRLGGVTSRRMGSLGSIHGVRSDGSEFPIEASISQMDAGGRHYFTVILRDISQRMRAEQELKENREMLEKAQEVGGIGSWWSDPTAEGSLRWSREMNRIYGLDESEFDGRVESFFRIVHPEDRVWVRQQADAALAGESKYSFDHRIIRKDGTTRWVHQEADIVFDDFGKPSQIVGITLDITERVRAQEAIEEREERFSALVSALTSVVWTTDAQGRFIVPQRSWEAFTGQKFEQHRDFGWADAIHRDDRDWVTTVWRNALATGAPYESEGRLWHAPTQSYHYFFARGVPLKNADGTIREWVGTVTDVDARKRAEQAVLAAKQAILEQQEMERERVERELAKARDQLVLHTRLATIGQVSASIAHELRNPLGAVRNAAYFLRRRADGTDEKLTQYLTIIDQEVETSDRIITNLMEMTRAKEPEKKAINLDESLDLIIANIPTPEGVVIVRNIQPSPFVLHFDPAQLRQVLSNLLTNAVQALKRSGEIRIDAMSADGYDTIIVRDSGDGVPADERERLFEPLYTTKAKGTGLGLTICRQIVERHGGTIDYLDDGVPGAAFRVRVPRSV